MRLGLGLTLGATSTGGGGPGPGPTRPDLALGTNVVSFAYFVADDQVWDKSLKGDWYYQSGGSTLHLGGPQQAFDTGALNASSTGTDQTENGVTYHTIKVDPDGRLYPTITSVPSLPSLTYRIADRLEPGSVPNNRFLLDFHGRATATNFTFDVPSGVGWKVDTTALNLGDLGNGKYIVILYGEFGTRTCTVSATQAEGVLPTCTPCDINGNTTVGRVTSPSHAARKGASCQYIRFMKTLGINNIVLRGDTPTSLARRSTASWYQGYITPAQAVKYANECGVGIRANFHVRDDMSAVAEFATQLALVNSPIIQVEYGNEHWNAQYTNGRESCLMGCRAGYDGPPTGGQVDLTHPLINPRTIYYGTSSNQTSSAVTTGTDYFVSISGIGFVVLRATKANAAGTAVPLVFSAAKTYNLNDMVIATTSDNTLLVAQKNSPLAAPIAWSNSKTYSLNSLAYVGSIVYISLTDLNQGNSPATHPGSWAVSTSEWMVATQAQPNGAAWSLVSTNTMTAAAGHRWRSQWLTDAKAVIDPILAAVGKSATYHINVQTQNTQSSLQAATQNQIEWNNGWRTINVPDMAPYRGGAMTFGNELYWRAFQHPANPVASLVDTMKWAYYTSDTPDAARATLVAQMWASDVRFVLNDASIRMYEALWPIFRDTMVGYGADASKLYMGSYEGYWTGDFTNAKTDWPENGAKAWVSTTTYNGSAKTAVGSFAYDGSEIYLSLTDGNIGNRPSTDGGTNWKLITRDGNGDYRMIGLFKALARDPGIGICEREYDIMLQQRMGRGYWTKFIDVQPLEGLPPTACFSWPFSEVGYDTAPSGGGYQTMVATNTDWKARQ